MNEYRDKSIAYIDREVGDEILETSKTDVLPRRGQRVSFRDGDGKGNWKVYDVRESDDVEFNAFVTLERTDT